MLYGLGGLRLRMAMPRRTGSGCHLGLQASKLPPYLPACTVPVLSYSGPSLTRVSGLKVYSLHPETGRIGEARGY